MDTCAPGGRIHAEPTTPAAGGHPPSPLLCSRRFLLPHPIVCRRGGGSERSAAEKGRFCYYKSLIRAVSLVFPAP